MLCVLLSSQTVQAMNQDAILDKASCNGQGQVKYCVTLQMSKKFLQCGAATEHLKWSAVMIKVFSVTFTDVVSFRSIPLLQERPENKKHSICRTTRLEYNNKSAQPTTEQQNGTITITEWSTPVLLSTYTTHKISKVWTSYCSYKAETRRWEAIQSLNRRALQIKHHKTFISACH